MQPRHSYIAARHTQAFARDNSHPRRAMPTPLAGSAWTTHGGRTNRSQITGIMIAEAIDLSGGRRWLMLTQSLRTSVVGNKISPVVYPVPAADQFGAVTGHASLIATEISYRKDEEIYGEDEPAEYVYQVISGAVRSYKLLSDGRRQIGAFHLPGDVFGLESESVHRLAAEAIIGTTVRLVK
jgi:hypothetical protein